MKNLGVIFLGLSLALSAHAFAPNKKKLAEECISISQKLESQRNKYSEPECIRNVRGLLFYEAAKDILLESYYMAQLELEQGIRELEYAKLMHCSNTRLLTDAIKSGKSIIETFEWFQ